MKNITITNIYGNYLEILQDQLSNIEGFEYSSVNEVIQDIGGNIPSVYITSRHGRRRMSFQYFKRGQTLAQRIEMLGVLAQTGDIKTMNFTTLNDLDLQCEVEVLGVKNNYVNYNQPYLIELVSPDFRFFSQDLNIVSTPITDQGGGTIIPTPIPASLSYMGIDRPVINVGGTVKSYPIFVVHGPGSNFIVQNITTSKKFELGITLLSSEYVTIDCLKHTVVKGTNTNVFGVFSGDFFGLEVGNNEIHFDAISGSGPDTLLTIKYRDTYAGI